MSASVQLSSTANFWKMVVKMWDGGCLSDITLSHCGRASPIVKSQLSMIPKFLAKVPRGRHF